jgi:hypothetical protein
VLLCSASCVMPVQWHMSIVSSASSTSLITSYEKVYVADTDSAVPSSKYPFLLSRPAQVAFSVCSVDRVGILPNLLEQIQNPSSQTLLVCLSIQALNLENIV